MKKLSMRKLENILDNIGGLVNTTIACVLSKQGQHQRPNHHELHQLTGPSSTPSEKLIREDRDAR